MYVDLIVTILLLVVLAGVATRLGARDARPDAPTPGADAFFAERDRFTPRGWRWILAARFLAMMAGMLLASLLLQ